MSREYEAPVDKSIDIGSTKSDGFDSDIVALGVLAIAIICLIVILFVLPSSLVYSFVILGIVYGAFKAYGTVKKVVETLWR